VQRVTRRLLPTKHFELTPLHQAQQYACTYGQSTATSSMAVCSMPAYYMLGTYKRAQSQQYACAHLLV
jgi:hypothetical protein